MILILVSQAGFVFVPILGLLNLHNYKEYLGEKYVL